LWSTQQNIPGGKDLVKKSLLAQRWMKAVESLLRGVGVDHQELEPIVGLLRGSL